MNASRWTESSVVVTGAGGMLGQEVVNVVRDRMSREGAPQLLTWTRANLDISRPADVQRELRRVVPAMVINCAAYTDVDGCEHEVDRATRVNAEGPAHLAAVCKDLDALLVHVSTDFIFDGCSPRAYLPDDGGAPLSAYGRSKWEGEMAIRASGCRHLMVRTSWLFGMHGRNFVEAILVKAGTGETLRVVNDQIGRPTLATDLGEALAELLDAGATGTFHFANAGPCSWYDFAVEIVAQTGLPAMVQPISSDQLSRPARRPAFSVLDTSAYERVTGRAPARWQDALRRYLGERAARRSAMASSALSEPSTDDGRRASATVP